ncbi:hypothetical protein K435DRAFT_860426 [Dendrothele bispora CBS 962.96]|uniref:Uncharacterized protein n=1 Tax=Dendrothele bispora (strain CBS 962.96) TaxID=1314807 RepID=A0A4S8LXZ0_DENBC|nr:hypothetical protein K435DRAFT_860426 [Dendrothele bispora CBS 962.96]
MTSNALGLHSLEVRSGQSHFFGHGHAHFPSTPNPVTFPGFPPEPTSTFPTPGSSSPSGSISTTLPSGPSGYTMFYTPSPKADFNNAVFDRAMLCRTLPSSMSMLSAAESIATNTTSTRTTTSLASSASSAGSSDHETDHDLESLTRLQDLHLSESQETSEETSG